MRRTHYIKKTSTQYSDPGPVRDIQASYVTIIRGQRIGSCCTLGKTQSRTQAENKRGVLAYSGVTVVYRDLEMHKLAKQHLRPPAHS